MKGSTITPKIDERGYNQFLEEFQAMLPLYTPQWQPVEKDPGLAVGKIASHMLEILVQRLNEVPGKNLTAFLSGLGVSLLPAQSAHTPLVFVLAEGTDRQVLIPAGTLVSAGKVEFATEKNLLATPSHLVTALSINPNQDSIFRCPPRVASGLAALAVSTVLLYDGLANDKNIVLKNCDGLGESDLLLLDNNTQREYVIISSIEDNLIHLLHPLVNTFKKNTKVLKINDFTLFSGCNLQQHHLYLGDLSLFDIHHRSAITLDLDVCFGDASAVTWEYYGTDPTNTPGWHKLECSHDQKRLLLEMKEEGSFEPVVIHGIESRWLRCQLLPTRRPGSLADFSIAPPNAAVNVSLTMGTSKKTVPALVFANDVPLDLTKEIYPFGTVPSPFNSIYIDCTPALALREKDTVVTLTFTVSTAPWASPQPSARVSWEYWDGNGWMMIPGVTENLLAPSLIKPKPTETGKDTPPPPPPPKERLASIEIPGSINPQRVDVFGYTGFWIRARLVSGDYGLDFFVIQNPNEKEQEKIPYILNKGKMTPPIIANLNLTFQERVTDTMTIQEILAFNNLEFKNIGSDLKREKSRLQVFLNPGEPGCVLYLGFSERLESGPITLYFLCDEKVEDDIPVLQWQYFREDQTWASLQVNDFTRGFLNPGIVEFFFPSSFIASHRYGLTLYWIRVLFPGSLVDSPIIFHQITTNAVPGIQAAKVEKEIVGASTGLPGQEFSLSRVPVISVEIWVDEFSTLTEAGQKELIKITPPIVEEIRDEEDGSLIEFRVMWQWVPDFDASLPGDRHYMMDQVSGRIIFGDGVCGKIPPLGQDPDTPNIFATYWTGGGTRGNLPVRVINGLITALPFVESVFNPVAADGGSDNESMVDVGERGTHWVKHRLRAVTNEDFEQLTFLASRVVARTKCIVEETSEGPLAKGTITMIVIPHSSDPKPGPSRQLKQTIEDYLMKHGPDRLFNKGKRLLIEAPTYIEISIQATLVARNLEEIPRLKQTIPDLLESFLHPLTGNFDHGGWAFGRMPGISDFFRLLEGIDGIDRVENLEFFFMKNQESIIISRFMTPQEQLELLRIPNRCLVCNGKHSLVIIPGEKLTSE